MSLDCKTSFHAFCSGDATKHFFWPGSGKISDYCWSCAESFRQRNQKSLRDGIVREIDDNEREVALIMER